MNYSLNPVDILRNNPEQIQLLAKMMWSRKIFCIQSVLLRDILLKNNHINVSIYIQLFEIMSSRWESANICFQITKKKSTLVKLSKITSNTASSSRWVFLTLIARTVVSQVTLVHTPVVIKDQLQVGQFVNLQRWQVAVVAIGVVAQLSEIQELVKFTLRAFMFPGRQGLKFN